MFIVTTMSYDELGALIRDKRVSLNNGNLIFGNDVQTVNDYFKDRIGYSGYVLGIKGKLSPASVKLFKQMDRRTRTGDHVIIEAKINEDDVLRYNVKGINNAAEAIAYGMSEDAIRGELDDAQLAPGTKGSVEVLCVPYLSGDSQVRVTSLHDELTFDVEGITFVKFDGV